MVREEAMKASLALTTVILVALIGVAVMAFRSSSGSTSDAEAVAVAGAQSGCGPASNPPPKVENFAELAAQGGRVDLRIRIKDVGKAMGLSAIKATGRKALMPSDRMGRTETFHMMHGPDRYTYLTKEPIRANAMHQDVIKSGGALLMETPNDIGIDQAQRLKGILGDRAAWVNIGRHRAVFVHSDEIAPGVRQMGVYWSDDTSNHSVITGFTEPGKVIELARSMVCG